MEAQEGTELLGRGDNVVAVKARHRVNILGPVDDDPGVHHVHRMQLELKGGHHAEVSATSAECPEKVFVLLLAGHEEIAVRCYHVGGDEVVTGKTIFPGQITDATAQGQACYTRGTYDAPGGGQAEGVRRVVEVGPCGAGLCPCCSRLRVHTNAGAVDEVQDEGVIPRTKTRGAVAAAPHSQRH